MTLSPQSLVPAIGDNKVVLCLGSGGVGKTTIAASLAIALAREGHRVVVLTIDPARRLADALGQGGTLGNDPLPVELPNRTSSTGGVASGTSPTSAATGEVWAAMLDPAQTFEAIIRAEASNVDHAERILNNRLFKNLTTSLSGTNEYMAAERLHQLANDERFDRVIIDTPPSRHAFDFLDSPGRLTRFVDHRLYRSVFASRNPLLKPLNVGAQVVMRLLARLVGSNLVDDVVAFFEEFEGLDEGFRRRAVEVEALLTGPQTAHVVVTAPRRDRLDEADWILGNLGRRGRSVEAVLVNRVLPIDMEGARRALSGQTDGPLAANLEDLLALAEQEAAVIDEVAKVAADRLGQDADSIRLVTVAEQPSPVRDTVGLSLLADLL